MFVIRKAQMKALSRYMVEQFVDTSLVHLKTNFPEQTKEIQDGNLRSMINSGIEKAARYNVTIEEDVLRYLEYMLSYGTDFDTDPATLWAGEILRSQDIDGPEKIVRLDDYMKTKLKE